MAVMFRFLICMIGLLSIWRKLRDLGTYIVNLITGKTRDLRDIYGGGSYALITGGSEGMGKAFAKEYARRGFHIILVARDAEKLNEAKEEITNLYPSTEVKTVSFDFESITNPENFDLIRLWGIDGSNIDISTVVSNVGVSAGAFFEKLTEEQIKRLIKVNMASQIVLAENFNKYFSRRRHRSAFIQTSSTSALNPFPYYDLYGATKAFNLYFSDATGAYSENIDFYAFMPSYVSTKLNNYRTGRLVVTPDEAVAGAMLNVGSSRRVFSGHWKHEALGALLSLVPDFVYKFGPVKAKLYEMKAKGFAENTKAR